MWLKLHALLWRQNLKVLYSQRLFPDLEVEEDVKEGGDRQRSGHLMGVGQYIGYEE